MIIFLNGTSSSGKSTIAKEIMHQSERPFLYYSIDHFVNFWLDEKFIAFDNEPRSWFFQEFMQTGDMVIHAPIVEGPHTPQLHWDVIESLEVLVKKGYDLIVDEVVWEKDSFNKFSHFLAGADKVYLIKIICDLIECERREKRREDRYKGLARKLYQEVYQSMEEYDFEVDTTITSAKDGAANILRLINQQTHPHAFESFLKKKITFRAIVGSDIPLLQKWMNVEQNIPWFNEGKMWKLNEVEKKFQTYLEAYKIFNGEQKSIYAYIIYCSDFPIGYIQYYNAYDFPRGGYNIVGLPLSLASLELNVVEESYAKRGLAVDILKQFLQQIVWQRFTACFLDPPSENHHIIQLLESAGFHAVNKLTHPPVTWMLKNKNE